jgi:glycerate kinase
MPRTVLIVPDKFKGTLTATQAARAIARGWARACPQDRLLLLPMSDGGDGFGAILSDALNARSAYTRVVDAAGRPRRVRWWRHPGKKMAVVESARVIGLAMLPPGKFHPFQLDTTGLGGLLAAVARQDCSTCLLGIGGSATNDGGFGMARALGWIFLDGRGKAISRWTDLTRLRVLRPPPLAYHLRVTVATDVTNPLLGPRGASRVYGPQKGLRPSDLPAAESALRQLSDVASDFLGVDHAKRPGAGAAGGLGFGLMAFLNANPTAGFDLFADYTRLEQHLQRADLVITGEGALDASTLMGKGVGQIADRCRQHRVPCIALGGVTKDLAQLQRKFARVAALTDLTTPDNARSQAAHWLGSLATRIAGEYSGRSSCSG